MPDPIHPGTWIKKTFKASPFVYLGIRDLVIYANQPK
jgi:hypothetical protein